MEWTLSLFKNSFPGLFNTVFIVPCLILSTAPAFVYCRILSFPYDPPWPAITLSSSHLHELKAEENIFAYTQLIIRSLYRQPFTIRQDSHLNYSPKLLAEWSQLCLLQIETPTKTACSFNSGVGYRLKHYQVYSPGDRHHIHRLQPRFLMPITMSAHSSFNSWQTKTILNMEFEIDHRYISRNISIGYQCSENKNFFADLTLSLHADHAQIMTMEHDAYRSTPRTSMLFLITAYIH